MRITNHQRQTILTAIGRVIPDASVMLFGSRADDSKRGGDIDLYVDLVVNDHQRDEPIFDIAQATGVPLA